MAQRKGLRPRRKPRQRRSRATVDAILEAAARVFAERGHAGGTTNHIARAAGVSVGSLYEYFPNKDAILVALVERQRGEMVAHVRERLVATDAALEGAAALLERFADAMLTVHEQEPDLHRLVFFEAPHPPELQACVLRSEEGLAHELEAQLLRCRDVQMADSDTAAHLIVQTAEALTHRFVHQGIHELSREDFMREVGLLLCRYVSVG